MIGSTLLQDFFNLGFIFTDLIGVFDKFFYCTEIISDQPYRIFTSILMQI